MRVTCPKCLGVIDVVVTERSLSKLRWGSNDLETLASKCLEWQDPANAEAKDRLSCSTLDSEVVRAMAQGARSAKR
jgi:hypothetical protein